MPMNPISCNQFEFKLPPPEPAFSSALNNNPIHPLVHFTCSANHNAAAEVLMKLRIAVLISKAAHQFMEAKDNWVMKQKNTVEEATATKYYCNKCRCVVTVHVEIKCPFCRSGFIQACQGVNPLYLAVSSDSEPSESDDTDGEGTTGLFDSNPSVLVTRGIGSQDANDDTDRATSSEWILLLISFGLEIVSAYFDQVSSPRKPHYALIGMLLAIVAVLACIWDLLHNGIKERVVLRRRGVLCCFHYPPPNNMLFGSFPDFFGLGLAIVQCIFSTVQYYFLHRHASNPIKLSPVPVIFFFGLVVSKLIKRQRYSVDENLQEGA